MSLNPLLKLSLALVLLLNFSNLSYAQSLSGGLLENIFFSKSERLQVTFGNLNKYSENYRVSVSKLNFKPSDVNSLVNKIDKDNSDKQLSKFFSDVKPESTTKKKLNKKIKLPAGKTRKVKVPVFNLEKNKLNFYRICSESEPKGGYVYEVCTHSVIYYSYPN
ncbi:hypothetical protein MHN79_14905 [Vibrio sp. Of14-4]|uniref:hypothetical protein n=1 Tax=Vibrio sp. Of14-4 TaxID=2724878 RepID=UPI001EF1FF0E|nr:hypothetical protein [Vibrio sp. Of14-4]MCG7490780.1 hypothetical protein [Vibrio sp. Of14-4]